MKSTQTLTKGTVVLVVLLVACGHVFAQDVTVTVLPARPVEERVADELKAKELRKAAEEKSASEESARIADANPTALLSGARTLFIDSDTSFFESVQLQNALRSRDELQTWRMAIVSAWDKRKIADLLIQIDRPLFTYTFTYEIIHRSTGIVLTTGKVTAFDGNAAAPKLAARIVDDIRKARGDAKPLK